MRKISALAFLVCLLGIFGLTLADGAYFMRERGREGMREREGDGDAVDAGPDIGGSFELAPADGGGMGGTACSGATITGSEGQTITLTRAGEALCPPQGLATSGLGDNSMPLLTNNYMRVVPDDAGILSLYIEGAATNLLTASQYLTDPAWTNTATVVDSLTGVTNQSYGNSVEDTSLIAAQNSLQNYVTTTIGNYVFTAYVKGSASETSVTLKLISAGPSVTTTCLFTGLSTTTWSRLTCQRNIVTSVSSITVEIYPGDSTSITDMGTIYVDAPQLETGILPSSAIYTITGPVARVADAYAVSGVSMPLIPSVVRAKVQGMRESATGNAQVFVTIGAAGYRRLWRTAGVVQADRGDPTITANAGALTTDGFLRGLYGTNGASATVRSCINGTCGSTTTGNSTGSATGTTNSIGYNTVFGYQINGLLNQLCVDSDVNRCNTP